MFSERVTLRSVTDMRIVASTASMLEETYRRFEESNPLMGEPSDAKNS